MLPHSLILMLVCFIAPLCYAQNTTVTATVTDPSSTPYAFSTGYAALVCPGNQAPTYNGYSVPRTFSITGFNGNGTFTQVVYDVSVLVPTGCGYQWHITYKDGVTNFITGTITTVTGSSVNESAAISAFAVPLPSSATGLSCLISAAVIFETASNTGGCASGFTFSTPNLTIPTSGAYEINGISALFTGPSANANLAVGAAPFPALTSGIDNVAVGDPTALGALTSGINNTAVGASTMTLTTTGQGNTAVGTAALQTEAATAINNTAVGSGSLKVVTSNANTAVGQGSLQVLTSGNQDVAIGAGAGTNTTGSGNTLIGFSAGNNLTSGGSNTIVGNNNGGVVSTGSNNVVIGVGLTGITATSSNQLDIMDVIVGTGMNVPATSVVTNQGTWSSLLYATKTNCSSSASPAVCGGAAAGSVALPTNAVSSSLVVDTTAVTANSQIFVQADDTLGTKLSVTCNSTAATLAGGLAITARTAGTSFTIANNIAVTTNPLCVSYWIVN